MSESYKVKGNIVFIGEFQHISDKFQKREFVLEVPDTNPQYTELISLEFIKEKCSLLDNYQIGMEVEAEFNLKGRKWDGPKGTKYFNTLQAWRISNVGSQGAPPAAYQQPVQNQLPAPSFNQGSIDESDNVPF